jgi:hypothetical protein
MNLLSLAVEVHDHAAVKDWLSDNGAMSLLCRTRASLERLAIEVGAGRAPPSIYGGNYPHVVFAHLCWALDDFSGGEFFVSFAERLDIADISTQFWREYARGMGSLVRGEPYQLSELKLRGQERYWVTYLHLIEAVVSGNDLEGPKAGIRDAFARRNTDKRITDDSYETEGSGLHPVRWDYRLDSLLTYVRYKGIA